MVNGSLFLLSLVKAKQPLVRFNSSLASATNLKLLMPLLLLLPLLLISHFLFSSATPNKETASTFSHLATHHLLSNLAVAMPIFQQLQIQAMISHFSL